MCNPTVLSPLETDIPMMMEHNKTKTKNITRLNKLEDNAAYQLHKEQ